ncbi:MAG TPA: hypothetical protein VIH57_00635 [Bacteroidales bacterium]
MKQFLTILAIFCTVLTVSAQTPQAISYQAIARDLSGNVLANRAVTLRISILKGSATGSALYVETHSLITNQFGLLNLQIGKGTAQSGNFATIDWSGGCFAKIEIDINGGTNFVEIATSQMLSVPYALYAEKANNVDLVAGPGISITGKTISNKLQLTGGDGIGISGEYPNLNIYQKTSTKVLPRSAVRGQLLTVNFSGGPELTFQQGTSTCPAVYPSVIFRQASSTQGSSTQGTSTQGSSTIIYPVGTYLIDSKTLEATFDIPSFIPQGLYDIIFGPGSACETKIPASFKVH